MPDQKEKYAFSDNNALKGKSMIAVTSGNRNSGKTWFSITLAHVLSLFKQKVLLFDADSGLNNSKIQLGLNEIEDLDAAIYGTKSLNQIVRPYEKGHFDIVVGNAGSSGLATMSVGRLQILSDDLDILSHSYDKTVLDIGAGFSDSAKVFAGMARSIIIICNDDVQSMTKSYDLIRYIVKQNQKTKIYFVINKVNSIEDGERASEIIIKTCREFLNVDLQFLGVVRNDTRVRDSIRSQSSIISRYPKSEAALDVINIAKRLLENDRFD